MIRVSLLRAALLLFLGQVGCTAVAVVGTGGADATTGDPTGPSTSTAQGATGGPGASTTTTGFTTAGSASISASAAMGSSSTGVACVPADCSDDTPCTIDTCDLATGACSHAPRVAGEPGDLAEGPCEGVCQTDATCGLALYRRNMANAVWTKEALSVAWSGANAPPPRGILAAEAGTTYELMVVVDDGMIYRRVGGAWLAPVSGLGLFGFDTTTATTLYSLSNQGGDRVILWFSDGGTMRARAAQVNGASHANDDFFDCSASAAFPCNLRMDWGTFTGPGSAGPQWFRFEDGNVYRRVGLMFTGSSPETLSDIWGDALTAPAGGTVRAALVVAQQEIQLVAP